MEQDAWLAESFEQHRTRLKAVANRMLGSTTEADDAVQETWLRFSRSDTSAVENLRGWLTTVVSRVCLNMLQARRKRPETPMDPDLPESTPSGADLSIAAPTAAPDPEQEALLAESVGLALLAVLDPEVVVRADRTAAALGAHPETRGRETVATFFRRASGTRPAFVDGNAGMAWVQSGRLRVVFRFSVRGDRIVGIDLIADPASLSAMDLIFPEEPPHKIRRQNSER